MDMQTINKEVQVNAFYFVRHTKNFKMFPKEVEVDGERRTFHESGLQYLIRKGQQLVELFDMSDAPFGSGYDIATLGHILHSEGEQRSRALLKRVFDALAPGGTIAIQEFLVNDERTGPPMGLIFAVNMLVNTDHGDTYSFNEIAGWLRDAGFVDARTLESPGPSPLILATKR